MIVLAEGEPEAPLFRWRREETLPVFLFTVSALVINLFPVPMFLGLHYFGGSILALLALGLYGPAAGIVVGAVASAATVVSFHHPFAPLWLILDIAAVSLLWQRFRLRNLVLFEAGYWGLVGWILVTIVSRRFLGLDAQSTLLLTLKHALNALINAVLAGMLLPLLISRMSGRKGREGIPFRMVLNPLLIFMAVIPALAVLIITGNREQRTIEREIRTELEEMYGYSVRQVAAILDRNVLVQEQLQHNLERFAAGGLGIDDAVDLAGAMAKPPRTFRLQRAADLDPASGVFRMEGTIFREHPVPPPAPSAVSALVPLVVFHETPEYSVLVPIDWYGESFYLSSDYPLSSWKDGYPAAAADRSWTVCLEYGNTVIPLTERAGAAGVDAEALARWSHPGGEAIFRWSPDPPSPFLPQLLAWKHSFLVLRLPFPDGLPVTFIGAIPFSSSWDRLVRTLLFSEGLIVLLIVLALLPAAYLADMVARPLRSLSVEVGNFQKAVFTGGTVVHPWTRIAEVNQLAESFGTLSLLLRRQFDRLNDRKEHLEERVRDRVRDIEAINRELREEIAERLRVEQLLSRSRDYYLTLFETFPALIWRADTGGECDYFNRTWIEFTGRTLDDERGTGWLDGVHPDDRVSCLESYRTGFVRKEPFVLEYRLRDAEGAYRWIRDYGKPYFGLEGEYLGFIGVCFDTTDSREATRLVRKSLEEKEVLLKEVHHRVKNNLQIISSMINLQAASLRSRETVQKLQELRQRVRSLALLHEEIYQTEDFVHLDIGHYFRSLVDGIASAAGVGPAAIDVSIEVAVGEGDVDLDCALPCGLIINELVTNAVKYAFPEGRTGRVEILLAAGDDDSVLLRVADNGVGLPKDLDVEAAETLGLQLVVSLARQISADLTVEREGGTTFRMVFARSGQSIRRSRNGSTR